MKLTELIKKMDLSCQGMDMALANFEAHSAQYIEYMREYEVAEAAIKQRYDEMRFRKPVKYDADLDYVWPEKYPTAGAADCFHQGCVVSILQDPWFMPPVASSKVHWLGHP